MQPLWTVSDLMGRPARVEYRACGRRVQTPRSLCSRPLGRGTVGKNWKDTTQAIAQSTPGYATSQAAPALNTSTKFRGF